MEYSKIKLKIANLNLAGKYLSQRNLIDIKKHFKSLDINLLKEELWFIIGANGIDNDALRDLMIENYLPVIIDMKNVNYEFNIINKEQDRIESVYKIFKALIPMSDDRITAELLVDVKKYFDTLTKDQLVTELWYIIDNGPDKMKIASKSIKVFLLENYRRITIEMLTNINSDRNYYNN